MGRRLPQLVPILSLLCSLYPESETIYLLDFGDTYAHFLKIGHS